MPSFDLAIIGAGPGGFEAALRARELGLKVALIDKADPGGTCLHSGCIPTKSLLASTKLITKIKQAEHYGLTPLAPQWDWTSLVQRKNRIVETLKKGMIESIKRSGVEWIAGEASFVTKNRLMVRSPSPFPLPSGERVGVRGEKEIEARFILIATGSAPTPFPGTPFDGERIFSSSDLLELKTLPRELLILGGGVIGVEFASIFEPLGVQVTIIEMLDRLIATEDEEISRRLESLFGRRGIKICTGERVKKICRGDEIQVVLDSGKILETDCVLVAIGRRPNIEALALEKAGIQLEKGSIRVNEFLETSTPGIFAIGDVTNRSTGLAHGATAEGIRVVQNLKGPRKPMDYTAIPNCIYTDPEVASVGASVGTGPLKGPVPVYECKVLFSSLGKSHVEDETEGFLKMTASKTDGKILRVSAIGAHVTELIHEAVLAIKAGITLQTLAQTVHAHPTESEILQKAAEKLLSLDMAKSSDTMRPFLKRIAKS